MPTKGRNAAKPRCFIKGHGRGLAITGFKLQASVPKAFRFGFQVKQN
jgi:hypothetical protein